MCPKVILTRRFHLREYEFLEIKVETMNVEGKKAVLEAKYVLNKAQDELGISD